MKKFIKPLLCLTLCLSLVLGSSLTSLASSSTISYSSFRIKYNITSSSYSFYVSGIPDTKYGYTLTGSVCEYSASKQICKAYPIWGGKGPNCSGTISDSDTPNKGYKFTNDMTKFHKGKLNRGLTFDFDSYTTFFNFTFRV